MRRRKKKSLFHNTMLTDYFYQFSCRSTKTVNARVSRTDFLSPGIREKDFSTFYLAGSCHKLCCFHLS